jgi:hypothetical protein
MTPLWIDLLVLGKEKFKRCFWRLVIEQIDDADDAFLKLSDLLLYSRSNAQVQFC